MRNMKLLHQRKDSSSKGKDYFYDVFSKFTVAVVYFSTI